MVCIDSAPYLCIVMEVVADLANALMDSHHKAPFNTLEGATYIP